jgi:hypothetical protein
LYMKKSLFTILSLVMVLSMTLVSTAYADPGSTTGTSAPGSWASSINIQNTGTTDATVDLLFYDGTGKLITDFQVTPVIGAGKSRSLYIPTDVSGLVGGQYSVVAQSTSPLQIVANASSTVPYTAGAYNGLQSTDVGTDLFFPGLYNTYYGFSSEMAIQNTTATTANITLKFFNQGTGAQVGSTIADTIPGNGTKTYSLASLAGIPTGNSAGLLSAQIHSDQIIGGVGNIWTSALHGEFGDYDGVVSGSTAAVYVPALYNNYYNFVSSLTVQNLSTTTVAHAVVTYSNGHTATADIAANQSVQFYQPNDAALPSGNSAGVFSASVTSTNNQPLVAIVNVEDKSKGSFASYNGANSAGTTVSCPVVMKAYYDWFTAETVQNVGTSPTDITVTYASGETNTFKGVPANGTINVIELASAGAVLADKSSVSATFTSTGGQKIVAVVQENSSARYTANPGDYLLAYTCTAQ